MNVILKKEAINYINKIFSLPYTGIEQDWDLEMANSQRVDEFISYYKKSKLSREEKIALISLILASFDDLLNEADQNVGVNKTWNEIKSILESERDVFLDLITYWSCGEESNSGDCFKISPFIREI